MTGTGTGTGTAPRATSSHLPRPRHDVCAIVVSHEGRRWLGPALGSLFEHAGEIDLDVVVADNGEDGSAEFVVENFERARAIHCENRGFAHANNRAAVTADARYVLFLNPDTEILDGTLAGLVAYMDQHPEVGLAGCRQLDGEGRLCPTARRFPGVARALGEAIGPEHLPAAARLGESELDLRRYESEFDCDWTSGSFLFVRREALQGAGLLDERFFFYSEEVDLCLRIRRGGWRIRHLPQMTIVHYGGSTGSSPRMEAQMAYARSQYAAKHFGPLRRRAFVIAIGLRHLLRWAAFSRRGGDQGRAEAHRRALMTLLGREKPPFGTSATHAVEPD
jgi:GT2 family glycosyltransferase